ncbi:MAG TPA: choice-of-anchor tandem repeat GloVer-containing protein [Terriglobia bacterium]|nr:choice-of-anchor tandem repeat GloVer-containing protein [Terriglobia bacterium]
MRNSQTNFGWAAAMVAAILMTLEVAMAAPAQSFKVMYAFTSTGGDGAYPLAPVISDGAGHLYGTTYNGGSGSGCFNGCGTVFELDATGKETLLYSFKGQGDAAGPVAGLVRDSTGTLYGTTEYGGAYGYGAVFSLDTAGQETVLHSFTYRSDGAIPAAPLILGGGGNLYGTTYAGGAHGGGAVFELQGTGNLTVLHSFEGGADGEGPVAGLIHDAAGNLDGTTVYGGSNNAGTVFRISYPSGEESVLYSFTNGDDGGYPRAGLIEDSSGNFYGTTQEGGAYGLGTVFKLDATGNETTLYSFTGGTDGSTPYAPVVQDKAGNLYGTTFQGGAYGLGVAFKLDAGGNETVLHSFRGLADGSTPEAGLILDPSGNLYGTTSKGGDTSCNPPSGCGVVFRIRP